VAVATLRLENVWPSTKFRGATGACVESGSVGLGPGAMAAPGSVGGAFWTSVKRFAQVFFAAQRCPEWGPLARSAGAAAGRSRVDELVAVVGSRVYRRVLGVAPAFLSNSIAPIV